MKFKTFLFCLLCISIANTSRVLVWIPTPSISHQVVFRPLVQELVQRGHEVVYITTDPVFPKGKTPQNLTEIDVRDISYTKFQNVIFDLPKSSKGDFTDGIDSIMQALLHVQALQLNSSEVKEAIFSQPHFDLLILEGIARPLLALSHVLKAPVIQVTSFGPTYDNLNVIGAPTHPLLYGTCLRQRLNNLSMWEKIKELYTFYRINKVMGKEDMEEEMIRKYLGNDVPSLSELKNNVDMLFLNIHPIFEGNHPVPPGVVYIWGIHKRPQKDLPQDLKSYLDNSEHGVIYMSFGSNTDPTKLPPKTIQMFLKVFCQLPYDVLFKWDADVLPGRCENVKIGRWFPQSDLLRHPKIKLFITQGGLQSTDEAITSGVPLVGIPMLGDQWYNVQKYVHLNIGVQLDVDAITEEKFKNAITTVIDDDTYRRNIKKLDELMRDEPMTGLQRAVWWTEYVLRHGGARHLRAPAANISWEQYLELKLVAVVSTTLFISFTLVIVLSYYLVKFVKRLGGKTKVD